MDDKERIRELEDALRGILANVAQDWYISHFARKPDTSDGRTGVAEMIHNQGVAARAAAAFDRARRVLQSA